MLDSIIQEKWLTAKAAYAILPAASNGDDVHIYNQDGSLLDTIYFLRQQRKMGSGVPNTCLSDFIAPEGGTLKDHIGLFTVTAGIGIEAHIKRFESQHDDYSSIMLKALADRLAEAFAELLHSRIRRTEWGYAKDETLSSEELILEKYRGIRPAPGYPACPDHTSKTSIFNILDSEARIGVRLTEAYAMYPASSVSGFYFAHPESRYFGLGKILEDQLKDYAARRGISVDEAERYLRPVLF